MKFLRAWGCRDVIGSLLRRYAQEPAPGSFFYKLGCVSIRAPMMGGNPPAPESLWGPFQTTGPKDVVFQVKPSHTVKAYEKV